MFNRLPFIPRALCVLAISSGVSVLFACLWGLTTTQEAVRSAKYAAQLQSLENEIASAVLANNENLAQSLCEKHVNTESFAAIRVLDLSGQPIARANTGPTQTPKHWSIRRVLSFQGRTLGYLDVGFAEVQGLSYLFNLAENPLVKFSVCLSLFQAALYAMLWNGIPADKIRDAALAARTKIAGLGKKDDEINRTLQLLRSGKEQVREQTDRLRQLATRDSLTGCLNRRSFFDDFERIWAAAKRYNQNLSCVMVDIDYFKEVNDKYGHPQGDEVIQKVAQCLINTVRECDVVGRYGGEEFAVLMPHTDIEAAAMAAERIRVGIEKLQFPGFSVSASLGVAGIETGAGSPLQLLDEADRSLYRAKRDGRNRVRRWDELDHDTFQPTPTITSAKLAIPTDGVAALRHVAAERIPYQAVTSLLAALSYRDAETAVHCMRVAKLALALGRTMLGSWDQHVLESAALLHDIGKIGVPDAVLLKPDRLTTEERHVMTLHGRMGAEIVEAAFDSDELVQVMRCYAFPYKAPPDAIDQPSGSDLPVCARIIAIADAFDSMTSDRTYRKGMTIAEAVSELRRCAGSQFDPQLVEAFAEVVQDQRVEIEESGCLGAREVLRGLGQAAEYVVQAFDDGDFDAVRAHAQKLASLAARVGEEELRAAAEKVQGVCSSDAEYHEVLSDLRNLVEQCQLLQRSFLSQRPTLEESAV